MSASLPTYQNNATSVAARNAELTGTTPCSDVTGDGTYDTYQGCNRAGSNAPGIGINTGDVSTPAPDQFTLNDQAEAARAPQNSQHIGGDGLGDGDASVNPINALDLTPGAIDVNDTLAFAVADTQAVDGVAFDTVTGAVNRTGGTIEVGETAWGTVPVA
jgi:hypothetical protein